MNFFENKTKLYVEKEFNRVFKKNDFLKNENVILLFFKKKI